MMMIWSQPAAMASSTPYWMRGLSTKGSISLGCALVAGRKRVPRPAAGKTALRTFCIITSIVWDASLIYLIGMAGERRQLAVELFQQAYMLQMEGNLERAAEL